MYFFYSYLLDVLLQIANKNGTKKKSRFNPRENESKVFNMLQTRGPAQTHDVSK
jgi:hypothetical protein